MRNASVGRRATCLVLLGLVLAVAAVSGAGANGTAHPFPNKWKVVALIRERLVPEAPRAIARFHEGWGSVEPTFPAEFFKDPMGVVHLSGAVGGGAVPGDAFTLPPSSRPAHLQFFLQDSSSANNGGDIVPARVAVFPDGTVRVARGAKGEGHLVHLDGITFRARPKPVR